MTTLKIIIETLQAKDGDRDSDPHWNTGLSSQGLGEEQNEGEYEHESKDHEGLVHPLRPCA